MTVVDNAVLTDEWLDELVDSSVVNLLGVLKLLSVTLLYGSSDDPSGEGSYVLLMAVSGGVETSPSSPDPSVTQSSSSSRQSGS